MNAVIARFADVLALQQVDVADADQRHVLGIDLGGEAEHAGQFLRSEADAAGERHTVDIAAGTALRRVHVGVRVDPDHAEFLALLAHESRETGHGADGDGMVAADHQRRFALHAGLGDHVAEPLAHRGNLGQELGVARAFRQALLLLHRHIAEILDFIAEGGQALVKVGDAHGRRPHIHAATSLAKVQWSSNNRNT